MKPALELLRTNVVSAKALRPRGAGFATAGAADSARSVAIWAIKGPTFHKKTSKCTINWYTLGYRRESSHETACHGHRCPLIGRICHPQLFVDGFMIASV